MRRRGRAIAGSAGRFLKRFLVLAVIALVVLGFGLIVSEQDMRRPSFTVQAQHTAAQAAAELADKAELLARPGGQDVFHMAEQVLNEHATLLRVPGPAQAAQPSPLSTNREMTPDKQNFIAALRTSAERNLAAAEEADPGIARLLASIGTAQWIMANEISLVPGSVPAPEVTASTPMTDPSCLEADESDAETLAVRSLRRAEHRSIYAYEVASGRIGTPGFEDKIALHRAAANQLTEFLRALCDETPPTVEAYALDPGYFTDPVASLDTMESQIIVAYADLISLSNGEIRHWAISRFRSATLAQHRPGTAPEPAPGIEDPASPKAALTGKTT